MNNASQYTENNYWKRVGYVRIEMSDGSMKSFGGSSGDGLDFKFQIEKFASNIAVGFNVSILGLSVQTINELTVWDTVQAYKRRRKIEVYAGYEDSGIHSPLVSGFIINAIPSPPPDMWLNMECMGNSAIYSLVDSPIVLQNKTRKEIVNYVAGLLGMKVEWNVRQSNRDGIVRAFTIEGSVERILDNITNSFDIVLIMSADRIIAYDKNFYNNPSAKLDSKVVDKERGLLALGNVTLVGADITVRLNDLYRLLDWVDLRSTLIPNANGLYVISRLIHVGHFRGKEWHTQLNMFRKSGRQ